MTRYTPLWQQGGSYSAAVDRNMIGAAFGNSAGGATGAIPTVVANTMNVTIPPGRASVPLAAGANVALCAWDVAEVVTSTAAPASGNTRIDMVILQVRDPQLDAGVNNDFIFQVLAGAPTTGVPVAPTVPANAIAICTYTVPAAVANLNGVTIVNARWGLGPPSVFPSSASFPAAGRGQLAVDGSTETLWESRGSPPAWGRLPGTIVAMGSAFGQVNPSTPGRYDMISKTLGLAPAGGVRVFATGAMFWGFSSGGWVNGVGIIAALGSGADVFTSPNPAQAPTAGAWSGMALAAMYDVAAGVEMGAKAAFQLVQTLSGGAWGNCTLNLIAVAQPAGGY